MTLRHQCWILTVLFEVMLMSLTSDNVFVLTQRQESLLLDSGLQNDNRRSLDDLHD